MLKSNALKKHHILVILLSIPTLIFSQEISFEQHTVISDNSDGYGRPRIVLTNNNNPLIIWRKDATPKVLKASKWNGNSFSAPYEILQAGILPSSWDGPEAASKGDTIYIVFTSLASSQSSIMLIKSFDGGITFSDTSRVSESLAGHKYRMANIEINENGQPIVSYMQYLLNWLEPKQMVNVSSDFGITFNGAIEASALSPGEPCDCCKSSIVSKGDDIFLMYRNNENNIRNSYVSKSNDGGLTFSTFNDMDDYQWILSSCPATTPRGTLIGDSIVVVKRSGATGNNEVVYSSISVNNLDYSYNRNIDLINGSIQNFPEVSSSNDTIAVVWQDNRTNMQNCYLSYSSSGANNLNNSISFTDSSKFGNKTDPDVEIGDGNRLLHYVNNTEHEIIFTKASLSLTTSNNFLSENNYSKGNRIFDLFGKKSIKKSNQILLYDSENGNIEKKIIIE
jgi:hypothetical protein